MQDFLSTVILLFIVIDPVGLAPMIQGMLKKYTPEKQKAILKRELVFALGLLLLFFFSGKFLLNLLGLEPATLNISGGILLFLVALGMVFPAKDMLTSAAHASGQDEPFIVPIAMPLMISIRFCASALASFPVIWSRHGCFPDWSFSSPINSSACWGKRERSPWNG